MELSFLVLIDHIIKNRDTFFRKYYIRYEMSTIFRQKMSVKNDRRRDTRISPPGKFLNSSWFYWLMAKHDYTERLLDKYRMRMNIIDVDQWFNDE